MIVGETTHPTASRSRSKSPSPQLRSVPSSRSVKIDVSATSIEMDLGVCSPLTAAGTPLTGGHSLPGTPSMKDMIPDARKFFAGAWCFSPTDKTTAETLPMWSPGENLLLHCQVTADEYRDTSNAHDEARDCHEEDSRDDVEDQDSEEDEDETTTSETSGFPSIPLQLEELKIHFQELSAVNRHLIRQHHLDDSSAGASVTSPRNRRGKREKLDGDKPNTSIDLNFNNMEEVQAKCVTLESNLETIFEQASLMVTEKIMKDSKSNRRLSRLKSKVAELKRSRQAKQAEVEALIVKADENEGKSAAVTLELDVLQDQLKVFSSEAARCKLELESAQERFETTINQTNEEMMEHKNKYTFLLDSLSKKFETAEKQHMDYVANADSRIAFLEAQGNDQRKTISTLTDQLERSKESESALRREHSEKFEEELRKSAVKTANFRVQVESLETELETSSESIKKTQDENSKLRQQLLEMSQVLLKVSRDTEMHIERLEKEKKEAELSFEVQFAEERSAQNAIKYRLSRSLKTMIATERALAEAQHNHLMASGNDAQFPNRNANDAELALAVQEANAQRRFVDELLDQLDTAIEEKSTLNLAVEDLQQRVDTLQAQNQHLQVQTESTRFMRNLMPTFGLPSLSSRQTSENQQLKLQLEEAVTQLADLEMSNFELRAKIENADKKVVSYAELVKEAHQIAEREKDVAQTYCDRLDSEKSRSKEIQDEADRMKDRLENYSAQAVAYKEKIEEQHRVLEELQAEKESLEVSIHYSLEKTIQDYHQKEVSEMMHRSVHETMMKDAIDRIQDLELANQHLTKEVSIIAERCVAMESVLVEERSKFIATRENSSESISDKAEFLYEQNKELEGEVKLLKQKCATLASKLAEARSKQKSNRPKEESPSTPKRSTTPSNRAKSTSSERKQPDQELKALRESCMALEKELAWLRSQRDVNKKTDTFEHDFEALRAKCSALEDELVKTRNEYESLLPTFSEIKGQKQCINEDFSKALDEKIYEIDKLRLQNIELESTVAELSLTIAHMLSEATKASLSDATRDEIPKQVSRSMNTILKTKEAMYEAQLDFLKIDHESKLRESASMILELTESRQQARDQLQSVEKERALLLCSYQLEKQALDDELDLLRNAVSCLRITKEGIKEDVPVEEPRDLGNHVKDPESVGGSTTIWEAETAKLCGHIRDETANRQTTEPEVLQLRTQVEASQTSLAQLKVDLYEERKNHFEYRQQMEEFVQTENNKNEQQLAILSSQIKALETQKTTVEEEAARLNEDAQNKIEELCSGITRMDQKIAELNEQALVSENDARVRLEEAMARVKSLEMDKKALEKRFESKRSLSESGYVALHNELNSAKSELEVVKETLDETEQQRQSLHSKLVAAGERHASKLRAIDEAHSQELERANNEIETLKNQKKEVLLAEKASSQAQALALSSEVNDYKQQLQAESEKLRSAVLETEGLERQLNDLCENHEKTILFTKCEHERQMDELSQSLKTAMRAVSEDASRQYVLLESEAVDLRSRLDDTASTVIKAESEIAALRAELVDTVKTHQGTLTALQLEYSCKLEDLTSEKAKVEARWLTFQAQAKLNSDGAASLIESLEKQIADLHTISSSQLGEVNSTVQSLQDQRDELTSQLAEATEQSKKQALELEANIEALESLRAEVIETVKAHEEALSSLELEHVATLKKVVSQKSEAEARAKKQQGDAKLELDRAMSLIEVLENQAAEYRVNASSQLGQANSIILCLEQERDELSSQLADAAEHARKKTLELEANVDALASIRAELFEAVKAHEEALSSLELEHLAKLKEVVSQKSEAETRSKKQQSDAKLELDRAMSLIEVLENQAAEYRVNASSQLGQANSIILCLEHGRDEVSSQLAKTIEDGRKRTLELESTIHEVNVKLSLTETSVETTKILLDDVMAKLSTKEQELESAKSLSSELRSLLDAGDCQLSDLQIKLEIERKEHTDIQDNLKTQNFELAQSVEELAQQLDRKMAEYKEFSVRHQKSEKKIQSFKASLSALSTQLKETTSLYTESQTLHQETEEKLKAVRSELDHETEKHHMTSSQLAQTHEEKALLTTRNNDLQEQIKLLNEEREKLEYDIQKIRIELQLTQDALASSIEEAKEKQSQFNAELEHADRQYNLLQNERECLTTEMERLMNAMDALNANKLHLDSDLASVRSELAAKLAAHEVTLRNSTAEMREVEMKNTTLLTELDQVNAKLEETKDQLLDVTSRRQQLSTDKENLSVQFHNVTADFNAASDRVLALQTEVSQANEKLVQAESKSNILEGDLKKRCVEVQESQRHVQELKKRLEELEATMNDEVSRKEEELEGMRTEKRTLEGVVASHESKIQDLEQNNDRTMKDLQDEKIKLSQMKQSVTSLAGVLEEVSSTNKALSARINELEQELDAGRQNVASAESQITELREKNFSLDNAIKTLHDDLEAQRVALVEAEEHAESLKAETAKTREEASDEKFANTLLKNFIGTLNTTNDTLQSKCNNLEALMKSSVPQDRLDILMHERDTLLEKEKKLSMKIDSMLATNEQLEKKLQNTMEQNVALEQQMNETKDNVAKLTQTITTMTREQKQSSQSSEIREASLAKEVVTLQLQIETMKRQLDHYRTAEQSQSFVASKSTAELEELKKKYSMLEAECNDLQLEVAQAREQCEITNDDLEAALSRGQMLDEELQHAEHSLMELTQQMDFINQQEEFAEKMEMLNTKREASPYRDVTEQPRHGAEARDEFHEATSGDSDDMPYDQRPKKVTVNTIKNGEYRRDDQGPKHEDRVSSPNLLQMDARACRKQSMARRTIQRPPSPRKGGSRVTFDDGSVASSYSRKAPAPVLDDRSVDSRLQTLEDQSVSSSTPSISFKKNIPFWNRR